MGTLNDVLADLYPTIDESKRIAVNAGLPSRSIRYDAASVVNWFNILQFASRGGDESARRILDIALAEFPDHKILQALKAGEPPVVEPPKLDWKSPEDPQHLERILGAQSTLLHIRFLEIGMLCARSVARIVRGDGSSGTGFLIGGGWLLTNNHVLPTAAIASAASAEFNYQQTANGLDAQVHSFSLDSTRFHNNAANDWAVAGISRDAERDWGSIPLEPVETAVDAFVNIIQHPGGGPKQIGIYHNTVTSIGNGRVQYLTDTLPGSSGSPVFNDQWQVVALHHSSVSVRDSATKTAAYRNEGIAIRNVIADLDMAGVRRDA
jgi:V8-like Glu-specific endopeptidase